MKTVQAGKQMTNLGQTTKVPRSNTYSNFYLIAQKQKPKSFLMIYHGVNQHTKNSLWHSKRLKDFFLSSLSLPFLVPFSFSLKDIWQYYLNLTEANEKQRSDWTLEYIMTEAFGLTDLQPQSLLQLGLSFMLPQTKSFDKYFNHFMVSYNDSIICDGICKVSQVCSVLFLDQLSYSRCVKGDERTFTRRVFE